jgi:hypothetical protein
LYAMTKWCSPGLSSLSPFSKVSKVSKQKKTSVNFGESVSMRSTILRIECLSLSRRTATVRRSYLLSYRNSLPRVFLRIYNN